MDVQSNFTETLHQYQQVLNELEQSIDPTLAQLLSVLSSRDAIESFRQQFSNLDGSSLAELVQLDEQLRSLINALPPQPNFQQCRQSLKPPETAWWWFMEPLVLKDAQRFNITRLFMFDWVWNTLTVAWLVGAGTFATNTVQTLSTGNLDLLQTFSTISQGAGLVFVTGGTLTNRGQRVVRETLKKMGVKPEYRAEVTCGFAALLFAITYGVNASLPQLGQLFYRQGLAEDEAGNFSRAKQLYQKAESLAPFDARIDVALGDLYATFAMHDKAKVYYEKAQESGMPEALNGLGRVASRTATTVADLIEAETYFRWGLAQVSESDVQSDRELSSFLYGHLGFVLIKKMNSGEFSGSKLEEMSEEAEAVLKKSVAIAEQLQMDSPGTGMAYCYLGILYDRQQQPSLARRAWDDCKTKALPASKAQYEEIVIYGSPEIAQEIEVDRIVRYPQPLD